MMRRLAVVPGTSWKTADMSREYLLLATRIGAPRAVFVARVAPLRSSLAVVMVGALSHGEEPSTRCA